jgi:uncharacterized protein YjbI with pentapeptide repeats
VIEIKNYLDAVLYRSEADTIKAAMEEAVKGGANLRGANLRGANLRGANLRGANLVGANLGGAKMIGANLVGANLVGANLGGANLVGANLGGANLVGANLGGAKMIGDRPILMIGPIGSRAAYLTAYVTDAGIAIKAGCWEGPLGAFAARVASEHGDNEHGREYAAAIAMIEAHAAIWTPASEPQPVKL